MDGTRDEDAVKDPADSLKEETLTMQESNSRGKGLGRKVKVKGTGSLRSRLQHGSFRQKVTRSVWLCLCFFSLGLVSAQRGPALLDLQMITGTNVEQASAFLAAFSAGSVTGAFLGGLVYDFLSQSLMLLVSLLLMGATTALTPLCSLYWLMVFISFLVACFGGSVGTGEGLACSLPPPTTRRLPVPACNADALRTWEGKGEVALQAIHFAFAVGAVLAPLITEPFLASSPPSNRTIEPFLATPFPGNQSMEPLLASYHPSNQSIEPFLDTPFPGNQSMEPLLASYHPSNQSIKPFLDTPFPSNQSMESLLASNHPNNRSIEPFLATSPPSNRSTAPLIEFLLASSSPRKQSMEHGHSLFSDPFDTVPCAVAAPNCAESSVQQTVSHLGDPDLAQPTDLHVAHSGQSNSTWRRDRAWVTQESSTPLGASVQPAEKSFSPEIRVRYAFYISAALVFLSALPLLVEYVRNRRKRKAPHSGRLRPSLDDELITKGRHAEQGENVEEETPGQAQGVVQRTCRLHLPLLPNLAVLAWVGVLFVFCVGVEAIMSSYLTTYVVLQLQWTKSQGALLASVYWIAFAGGRFSGIFLVRLLDTAVILAACFLLLIVSSLGLLVCSLWRLHWGVWVSGAVSGLSLSLVYPSGLAWVGRDLTPVTGTVSAVVLLCANAGAMVNTPIVGHLMETRGAIWLAYVMLGEATLCLVTFCLLLLFSRLFLRRKYASRHVTVSAPPGNPLSEHELQGFLGKEAAE